MTTTTAPAQAVWNDRSAGGFAAAVRDGRVVLAGELDIAALETLRTVLDQALLESGQLVRIDATRVSFIDSAAISELLRYQLIGAKQGRRIWLEQVSHHVAEILGLLDLGHILMVPEHQEVPRGGQQGATT